MEHISDLIEIYGIYAVFVLCTVEGDITLLLSGAMAHGGFFGRYSFFWVFLAGTFGGIIGDTIGYMIGRGCSNSVADYRFYKLTQPRIERLIDKFGGFAIIISKYIYGIRVAMCVSYGIGKMPFPRFLLLDAISCSLWALILAGVGYFFSGAITGIIGDFKHIGVALFFIVLVGVVVFYVVERYWLSEKVEAAKPETINKIEEKLHNIEEAAQGKLMVIGERLHLTSAPNRAERKNENQKQKIKRKQKIKGKSKNEIREESITK